MKKQLIALITAVSVTFGTTALTEPHFNSFYFNSVSELIDFVSTEAINEVIEFMDERPDGNGAFRKLVSELKNGSLYVPKHQGEEIFYRNQEGFHNVMLFPHELYSNPWIMYFPDKTQSGVERISIMYLSNEIQSNHEHISELISEIAPDAPNIHNYSEYPRFTEIYISELQLKERKVNTLVHDLKNDVRKSIFFAYDGVLVMILTEDEKIPHEWLKEFSFSIAKYCDVCLLCVSNKPLGKGQIIGSDTPTIFDALEILKHIVGMDSEIAKCGNAREAALITAESKATGEPTIFDVLEILKCIVGMDNAIDG